MIKRLLIANRGEIACRILKTAKAMGITCIVVYAEPDANTLACRLADIAYPLGGTTAKDSYLSIEKIIDAAKQTEADAIHPGYGFLSENPDFAAACEANGLIFVGPTVAALRAMGSKQTAKAILSKTEVPLIPGYHGTDQDPKTLQSNADAIGYPVLLKAAAGGGGKGMRLVHHAKDFQDAREAAAREALASFGDDTLIIEKYLQQPRHIEVQILADAHGNVVHLFERDCSIQRRHQKIIEEAPALALPESIRDAMMAASLTVARSIEYLGAGTIEYLFDGQGFYFMEMNTRLQVEHPITELITGLDIVAAQLCIAAGDPLPFSQSDITARGHAIECRICAEDPYHGFLPSFGTVRHLAWPVTSDAVRIDTALESNTTVTAYFDPLLAKLAVWGHNREAAIEIMHTALMQTEIIGIHTNVDYLGRILRDPDYRAGNTSTHFVDEHPALLAPPQAIHQDYAIAALFDIEARKTHPVCTPWKKLDGWRANQPPVFLTQFVDEHDQVITLRLVENAGVYTIEFNDGVSLTATTQLTHPFSVIINGKPANARAVIEQDKIWLFSETKQLTLTRFDPLSYYANSEQNAGHLSAPMPGMVVAVMATAGKKVSRGDNLMVIEAMKMQHTIKAPQDGIVKQLYFKTGDLVKEGMELMAFEASA